MQQRGDSRDTASREMVRMLAGASDLALSEERVALLVKDLQGLLDRVSALYRLNVGGAQPSPPFNDEVWG